MALTGGRTAEKFYRVAAEIPDFLSSLENVDFFWSDERCVSSEHIDSNYRLAVETLFSKGIPKGARLYRMEADDLNLEGAAARYSKLLPHRLHIILLSVGEDGHIASIFPGEKTLDESNKKVVLVQAHTNRSHKRFTITPPVIRAAHQVFVLAVGGGKE